MRASLVLVIGAVLAAGCGSMSPADHAVHAVHADHDGHAGAAAAPADGRLPVELPEPLRSHTLANMRDHLAALQEIQQALAGGAFDKAARVAEDRLGMTSLKSHGAHDVARFIPEGMQAIGTEMHRSASRLAVAATDAGVTGDVKPALGMLARVTGQCVACHASYRMK
jgi:hypothetical protein